MVGASIKIKLGQQNGVILNKTTNKTNFINERIPNLEGRGFFYTK